MCFVTVCRTRGAHMRLDPFTDLIFYRLVRADPDPFTDLISRDPFTDLILKRFTDLILQTCFPNRTQLQGLSSQRLGPTYRLAHYPVYRLNPSSQQLGPVYRLAHCPDYRLNKSVNGSSETSL